MVQDLRRWAGGQAAKVGLGRGRRGPLLSMTPACGRLNHIASWCSRRPNASAGCREFLFCVPPCAPLRTPAAGGSGSASVCAIAIANKSEARWSTLLLLVSGCDRWARSPEQPKAT